MSYSHRLMIVVVLIINTGCGSTTSVSKPTSLVSILAPPESNFESTPTNTIHQPLTPFPTATPNSTQTAIAQTAVSAQSTQQSLLASFPHICKDNYSSPKFSPDGLWLVELCYSEIDQDLIMTLSNRETQDLWKLLYQEHLPKMDFVPDGGMSVVHWSNDGRYAYFTAFLGGDGGECFYGNQLETGTGLFRIDLQTGHTTAILQPVDNSYWYSFSVSPTDRRLVYGVHSRDLKVLDVTTGQLIDIVHKSEISQSGGYLWSPDGLQLVYSTVTSLDNWETRNYSLRLVSALSGDEQILLESPEHCFATISWTANNMVMVEKDYGEALIEFDLNSRKIVSEATVTPYP
jgi:WD40-like Beta Propeller Repeat